MLQITCSYGWVPSLACAARPFRLMTMTVSSPSHPLVGTFIPTSSKMHSAFLQGCDHNERQIRGGPENSQRIYDRSMDKSRSSNGLSDRYEFQRASARRAESGASCCMHVHKWQISARTLHACCRGVCDIPQLRPPQEQHTAAWKPGDEKKAGNAHHRH